MNDGGEKSRKGAGSPSHGPFPSDHDEKAYPSNCRGQGADESPLPDTTRPLGALSPPSSATLAPWPCCLAARPETNRNAALRTLCRQGRRSGRLAPHMARMSLERIYADEDLDEAIDARRGASGRADDPLSARGRLSECPFVLDRHPGMK